MEGKKKIGGYLFLVHAEPQLALPHALSTFAGRALKPIKRAKAFPFCQSAALILQLICGADKVTVCLDRVTVSNQKGKVLT